MGCTESKPESTDPAERSGRATAQPSGGARSTKRSTKQESDKEAKTVKLLVLGAGESGKSTLLKQMKVLHKGGYSEGERADFAKVVHSNAILSARSVFEGFERLGIAMPEELAREQTAFESDPASGDEHLTPQLGEIIARLWAHPAARKVFERRAEYQLSDSAEYYFDNVDRMAAEGYVPTELDVLRSRIRTTGIVRTDFRLHGNDFAMYDMGGQRNERRKWIHTFEGVNAIIFVAALSEFDQVLFEDESQNRMQESINLFEQIVNSKWFDNTAVILFLNKRDLFEEKLKRVQVADYFEDFGDRDNEFEPAADFFRQKFLAKCKNQSKTIFTHYTVATDKKNVDLVFKSVVSSILEDNLKASGLM